MPEDSLTILIGIALGVGLSAACGFRVFVPILIASISAKAGWLAPAEGFEWIGSWPAISAFGGATVLEIGAYYIPWLDNLLDTISTPTAVIAGILAAAACMVEMDPLMQWSLAAILGGGSAGVVKGGMVTIRAVSTSVTGGFGNAVVATGEWLAALVLSVLAVVLPILAGILALILVVVLARFAYRCCRRLFRPHQPAPSADKA